MTPARIGTGHTHCTPKGMRYDHWSSRPMEPLLTAAAKNWPMTQHMLINVVRYGRNTTGATSDAYAGVTLWKAPQGMPRQVSFGPWTLADRVAYRREPLPQPRP